MKQEIPKPLLITIIAVVVIVAIGFGVFTLNPPAPKTPEEIGGGGSASAGPGGLAPIGPDGKPIEEPKSSGD